MQPQQPKSIGGALVDVFDAALTLVKAELKVLTRRVGSVVKAKGLGAVLLLAAAAPLSLALIFLILALFFGLVRLGLGYWASALVIAILSLVVTGVLVMIGMKRLSAEVSTDGEDPVDRAREDLERAEKKREAAEKAQEKLEKQEKKNEKRVGDAERDIERARTELAREQHHSASVAHAASAPTPPRVEQPGIPVSTKPEIEQEDRR